MTDDNTTKSTKTRWQGTGTTTTLLLMLTLCGLTTYHVAKGQQVPLWLASTFSLATLASIAWNYGSGALKAAKDAVGGGGK